MRTQVLHLLHEMQDWDFIRPTPSPPRPSVIFLQISQIIRQKPLPAISMHFDAVKTGTRFRRLCRPPDRDDRDRQDVLGQCQRRPNVRDAFLPGMDAKPAGAEAQDVGREQHGGYHRR